MPPLVQDPTLHSQQQDYHDSIIIQLRNISSNILRYLKGTKELKIKYDGASDAGLIGYSDSDLGENKDDHHSTSGNIFLMANGCISWALQQQKTVALSVGEAEYMELASTG